MPPKGKKKGKNQASTPQAITDSLPKLSDKPEVTIPTTTPSYSRVEMELSSAGKRLLLSQSNRAPTDAESAQLLKSIEQHQRDLFILDDQIKEQEVISSSVQSEIDELKTRLMLARSLQVMTQRHLDSNVEIEMEASLTEQYVGSNKLNNQEPSKAFQEMVAAHTAQLSKRRSEIEDDIKMLQELTSQVQTLQQEAIEAGLSLQISRDTIYTKQQCRLLLAEAISRYRQLLVRGRGLPNELLIKIFSILIDSEIKFMTRIPKSRQGSFVLKLSSLCAGWRHLVQRTPQLWQYVPLPAPRDDEYESRIEVLEKYCQNMANHGYITIHWPTGSPWETMDTDGFSSSTSDPLAYYEAHRASESKNILEKLSSITLLGRTVAQNAISEVNCPWPATVYAIHSLKPRFTGAAALSITKLSLFLPTLEFTFAYNVLRHLRNLQDLNLQISTGLLENFVGFQFPMSSIPFHMGHLEKLSSSPHILLRLLETIITASKLNHLGVQGVLATTLFSPTKWRTIASSTLLERIKQVSLIDSPSVEATVGQFIPIINSLPGVETIELIGPHLTSILPTLTNKPSLPALDTLILRECDVPGLAVKQLLQSRKITAEAQRSQITKVVLDGTTKITRACCEEMMEMVEKVIVYG